MPAEEWKYSRIPGVVLFLATSPTTIDHMGMDGLYVQAVYVVNYRQFERYCDIICKPWYKFSVN